jgi:hypothetical protein
LELAKEVQRLDAERTTPTGPYSVREGANGRWLVVFNGNSFAFYHNLDGGEEIARDFAHGLNRNHVERTAAPASEPPPETDHCHYCTGERCAVHGDKRCLCDTAARHGGEPCPLLSEPAAKSCCEAMTIIDGSNYYCTLDDGHPGKHEAAGSAGNVYHRWPQEPQPASEPPLTPEQARTQHPELWEQVERVFWYHEHINKPSVLALVVALVLRHAALQYGKWTTLNELRPGAMFEDAAGLAVLAARAKSEWDKEPTESYKPVVWLRHGIVGEVSTAQRVREILLPEAKK